MTNLARDLSAASHKLFPQHATASHSHIVDRIDQEIIMNGLKAAALLAGGLVLSGCDVGGSTYSEQESYGAPGYYGTPGYAPSGYGGPSGYAAPYGYQPGYVAPYAYGPGFRGDGGHEHRDHEFHHDGGRPINQQPQGGRQEGGRQEGGRQGPPPGVQPHAPVPAAPMAARPPPAAAPQADHNRKLIDQLGFKPSH
jgi:hypothetical protein